MQIDVTNEERDILIRWKKRSDTYKLVRMKAEAIAYAARGVGLDIIVEVVERAGGTVRGWLSRWWCRLGSVVTGHAGDGRAQEEELEGAWADCPRGGCQGRVLGRPGSLRTSRPVRFGVWYGSGFSLPAAHVLVEHGP